MSVLDTVPTWARPAVDRFRETGTLPGQDVERQAVPGGAARELEAHVAARFDQYSALDESEADLARGERGRIHIQVGGGWLPVIETTVHYEGDSRQGSSLEEVDGVVSYARFGPESVDIVAVGGSQEGARAAEAIHLDRQNPANSYALLQGDAWNLIPV